MAHYFIIHDGKLTSCSELPSEDGENIEVSLDTYIAYQNNPAKFYYENGDVKENENWERGVLDALCLTKLEFFNYVLKPNGITYAFLLETLAKDDTLQATWDLCSAVFRGDSVLNEFLFKALPDLTSDALDDIYRKYGHSN